VRTPTVVLGLALFCSLALVSCTAPVVPASVSHLALVGGTVYVGPEQEPVQDGVVLVRGGVITAVGSRTEVPIPAQAEVLDVAGRWVTAGFHNSHVHFFGLEWADADTIPRAELAHLLEDRFARYGFTTVFDTGSAWDNTRRIRERIESGEVPGPRIRSTGEALTAPDAMPSGEALRSYGIVPLRALEVSDAEQAAAAATEQIARGVDGLKVHLQPPPGASTSLPESAIRAAVAVAHRADRPVFVHPNTNADVLAAARAGVDVIVHTTPGSGPWSGTVLDAMRAGHVALTPTLTLWKSLDRSAEGALTDTALGQLRAWIDAGGSVLFGTDLGAVGPDPRGEYELMARAGMGFHEILAALTTAPSERFGESATLGRIAAGLWADLVVLNADPAQDAKALGDVRYTLSAGKVIYADPAASAHEAPPSPR